MGKAIQDGIKGLLQAVTFTGIDPSNIRVREKPLSQDDNVEITPSILICPYGAQAVEPIGFEASVDVSYGVEVTLIDATEGLYGVDQAQRQLWVETVGNTILFESATDYRTSLPGVPSVWNIEMIKSPVFDRGKFGLLYSYSNVLFMIHSTE